MVVVCADVLSWAGNWILARGAALHSEINVSEAEFLVEFLVVALSADEEVKLLTTEGPALIMNNNTAIMLKAVGAWENHILELLDLNSGSVLKRVVSDTNEGNDVVVSVTHAPGVLFVIEDLEAVELSFLNIAFVEAVAKVNEDSIVELSGTLHMSSLSEVTSDLLDVIAVTGSERNIL